MKVLLINAPTLAGIVADMSDFFETSSGAYPPLGLMYLAAALRPSGRHAVEILDANAEGLDYAQIRAKVAACAPDLVGITALTFNLPTVLKVAADVKAALPGVRTVLGGPHPTIYPEETLAFPQVDFVVQGEGEDAFGELLDALDDGTPLEQVASLGFKRQGSIVINETRLFIEDMDRLPFPALDLVPYRKYSSVLSSDKLTMVMMSSRGCPYKCIYCDRPHLGRKFRARNPANVVDEMARYVNDFGITDIKFFDDTFTVNRQRALGIAAEILRRKLSVTWSMRARVNTVDYELLRALKESGLCSVSFGIESGNQQILDNLQKGITLDQVTSAVKACRRLRIEVLGDFILGNPGEGEVELNQTLRFARRLGLDYAQFTIMTPYPSTELYRMGLEKGIIKSDHWRAFARNPTPDFVTPVWEEHFTKEQLVGFLRKAYRSFYFRPGYVLRRLARISSFRELGRKLGVLLSLIRMNLAPTRALTGNFKRGSDGSTEGPKA